MKSLVRCVFHVHTCYSFDSLLQPREIVARARANNLDVLAVTDHETLRGAREVASIANGNPRHIIRAAEYKTDKGDLIGLFLKEEIRSRKSAEVIREIKAQGGLVLVPHPFKGHPVDDKFVSSADLVETYNARCSPAENNAAKNLAARLRKPWLAGCDAHFAAEIGAAVIEFESAVPSDDRELQLLLLTAPPLLHANRVPPRYRRYSQMIKAAKTRDPRLFLYQCKRLLYDSLAGRGELR